MFATGKLLFSLLVLVLGADLAAAQDRPPSFEDIPPLAQQPREHFYRALAHGPKGVEAKWIVSPEKVAIDGELSLTLIVSNAANPTQLTKPPLDKFEAFTKFFQVFLDPDPPAEATAREVRFRYRLLPRSLEIAAIPSLKYLSYRSDTGQFLSPNVRSVPITVTPPGPNVSPSVAVVPLEGPEEFFEWKLVGEWEYPVPSLAWVVPILAVPLLVLVWIIVWRELFPDAARQRRSRSARRALSELNRARTSSDPPKHLADVLRAYLLDRFAIPRSAQTPRDVAEALRALRVPPELIDATEALLQVCDSARFGGPVTFELHTIDQAEHLVTECEKKGV